MYRLTLLLLPLCTTLACNGTSAATGSTGSGSSGGLTTTTAGSTGGAATGSTGGSTTGSTTAGTTGSTGTAPPVGCTSDLRNTTDQNGNIVGTCLPSQGCSAGICIAACAAAAAAQGSIGCDFYPPDTPFTSNGQGSSMDGPCYAAMVANPWPQPAHLLVDYGATSFPISSVAYIPSGIAPNVKYTPVDSTQGLAPGQSAVLFLSASPSSSNGVGPLTCPQTDVLGNPIAPAMSMDAAVQGSGKGTAFHLSSDTPVQVHDILPYGGFETFLPGGSLLFPSSAWGSNYMVAGPMVGTEVPAQQWLMAIGQVDSTTLTVNASATLPGGGGIADCTAGTPTTFTINRGQILQWIGADPTGAVIAATQPVAILTGNTDLGVANDYGSAGGGDAAHQQLPPIAALGSAYVAPGYSTREPDGTLEKIPYTLIGVVDGTTLGYDPGPPPGSPATLNAGQSAEFVSGSTFAVTSQDAAHPFLLTQYMPGTWSATDGDLANTVAGCSADAGSLCGLGDEEWVVLPPVAQFLERYVFATEPSYATTNLTIVRRKTDAGFQEVNVGCLGGAVPKWSAVGDGGVYEVAYVDLYRGGVGVGACGASKQEADSAAPFGLIVWGTDSYVSYAYAAGGNLAPLNNVIVAP